MKGERVKWVKGERSFTSFENEGKRIHGQRRVCCDMKEKRSFNSFENNEEFTAKESKKEKES